MKKLLLWFSLLVALLLSPPPVRAADTSLSYFYDSLAPYGSWYEIPDQGFVWQPDNIGPDWQPYSVGGWAYTDSGWTWLSEEPFGSITFHYGRWARLHEIGWVWYPDTEWAPAWVSWRTSDKHIGWAPLPPEAQDVREHGVLSWADNYYDIGPGSYTFIKLKHLGAPNVREFIAPRSETLSIVRETRNVTNIVYRQDRVYVGGPEYEVVTRQSSAPIRRLRLERREDFSFRPGESRAENFRPQIEGGALRVFAPLVISRLANGQAPLPPPRVARRFEPAQAAQVEHGWGNVPGAEGIRAEFKKQAAPPPASMPAAPAKFVSPTAVTAGAAPGRPHGPGAPGRPAAAVAPTPATGVAATLPPAKPMGKSEHGNQPGAGATPPMPGKPMTEPSAPATPAPATKPKGKPDRGNPPGATATPTISGKPATAEPNALGTPTPAAKPKREHLPEATATPSKSAPSPENGAPATPKPASSRERPPRGPMVPETAPAQPNSAVEPPAPAAPMQPKGAPGRPHGMPKEKGPNEPGAIPVPAEHPSAAGEHPHRPEGAPSGKGNHPPTESAPGGGAVPAKAPGMRPPAGAKAEGGPGATPVEHAKKKGAKPEATPAAQ